MSTTVPTANIVVGFSREAMDRLFSVGATSKNLISAIQAEDDVLLFGSQSNPNFISFEHKFGLGAGGTIMSLTFIDPKGEFEERYLTTSLLDNIASYAFPSEEDSKPRDESMRDRRQREMARIGKGGAGCRLRAGTHRVDAQTPLRLAQTSLRRTPSLREQLSSLTRSCEAAKVEMMKRNGFYPRYVRMTADGRGFFYG